MIVDSDFPFEARIQTTISHEQSRRKSRIEILSYWINTELNMVVKIRYQWSTIGGRTMKREIAQADVRRTCQNLDSRSHLVSCLVQDIPRWDNSKGQRLHSCQQVLRTKPIPLGLLLLSSQLSQLHDIAGQGYCYRLSTNRCHRHTNKSKSLSNCKRRYPPPTLESGSDTDMQP